METNKENTQPCQKEWQDFKTQIIALFLTWVRYVAPFNFKEFWSLKAGRIALHYYVYHL